MRTSDRRPVLDFRSPGRGRIDFEGLIRQLNHADYAGPLTVEWEDPMMDREAGATEAAAFVRRLDFERSARGLRCGIQRVRRRRPSPTVPSNPTLPT